jgi:hypothetical protein
MAGYTGADLFKQVQELMKKCDDLSYELKKQKEEYTAKISVLEKENAELKEKNIKLENEVDRLKKQINNDSNNSSKPPSTDIKPNIPNNREKSDKQQGGQFGHKAQFLDKKVVEEKIINKEYKHEVVDVGTPRNKYISKYVLDIEVNVIAKEYRFYPDKDGKYNIPKEFGPNVQYGNELKTMCSILNTEGIVAIDRLTDFINNITHGKLSVSHGSAINFVSSLAEKSENIIERIKEEILNAELMNTDATTGRCNNKNICIRNYSANKHTLLIATKGKGRKYIEETGILPKFTGTLVHDHETVMYRYGGAHGECNVHVGRYLKGDYENIKHEWSRDMRNFLNSLNGYRKCLMMQNIQEIDPNKLEKYSQRYDEILEAGYAQNKLEKSRFYKAEDKKLLNRLKKYKENHLLFLYDFNVPFDNNLSERALRHVKTKQKVSGYFSSMEGLQNYLDIKSIIITCKEQGIDFYKTIFNIYKGISVAI